MLHHPEPPMMIKEFIRDRHGLKGVLVGVKEADGEVYIGWSLCSNKDTFDKKFGTELALNRIRTKGEVKIVRERKTAIPERGSLLGVLPHSLYMPVRNFATRCNKYFHCECSHVIISKHWRVRYIA